MRRYLLLLTICGGLFLTVSDLHAWQDVEAAESEETADAKAGSFEVVLTVGEETDSFENPGKAIAKLRRVIAIARRNKDEEVDFQAVVKINGGEHSFSDPRSAQKMCQAVNEALRHLRSARIGFGELGEIEPVTEPAAATESATGEKPKLTPAQARVVVNQRIKMALQQDLMRRRSAPSPISIQRIINQEVEKARAEGLLQDANPAAFSRNMQFGREQRIEAVRTMLGRTLAQLQAAEESEQTEEAEETEPTPDESE